MIETIISMQEYDIYMYTIYTHTYSNMFINLKVRFIFTNDIV